jgi:hypothetical protein
MGREQLNTQPAVTALCCVASAKVRIMRGSGSRVTSAPLPCYIDPLFLLFMSVLFWHTPVNLPPVYPGQRNQSDDSRLASTSSAWQYPTSSIRRL